MSDEELFRQFLTGDAAGAFQQIHTRYADLIERLCFARLHNTEDARDATQATFMVLLLRRDKLKPIELLHYLRRTARYAVAEIQRKRAADQRITHDIAANTDHLHWPDDVLSKEPDTQRRVQIMLKALETMTPQDQHLLRQHFLLGLSVKEIAETLGISERAMRTRQWRALKRLAALMGRDPGDNPRRRR